MAFALIDKNYEDYVVIDKEYLRPEELPFLKGDSSKFRHATGWLPKISFENMIEEMMKDWTDRLA
jgi:GDPmannose 4,6-dehydratase